MARFAPVVPLAVADALWDMNLLGNYHLLLAHDVLAHPGLYKSLYSTLLRATDFGEAGSSVVIMDNSVVELGNAMTFHEVLNAARIVDADYIVAADSFLESRLTIERGIQFADQANAAHHDEFGGVAVPSLMGVVQGRTIKECMDCAEAYADHHMFESIGIPRCLVPVLGSRTRLTLKLYERYADRFEHWHLLGLSEDLLDDVCTARLPMIHGIDSAAPIRGAMNGVVFDINGSDFGPRGDFWQASNLQAWNAEEQIRTNLELIRGQIA